MNVSERLPISEYFHRIESLIPEDQELLAVQYSMSVSEALGIMEAKSYSQLPVMSGNKLRGLFSYRSFAHEYHRLTDQGKIKHLGSLQVERMMFKPKMLVSPEAEISEVFTLIDRYEAVLVGSAKHLIGVVTSVDLLKWLDDLGQPFIRIGEIERSLRAIVDRILSGAELKAAADLALSQYCKKSGREVPSATVEMNLRDLQLLVVRSENWPLFEGDLGGDLDSAKFYLDPLPEIRNRAFHFREELSTVDRQTLDQAREWLLTILTGLGLEPATVLREVVETSSDQGEPDEMKLEPLEIPNALNLGDNQISTTPIRKVPIRSDESGEREISGERSIYRVKLWNGSQMLLADERSTLSGSRMVKAYELEDDSDSTLRSLQSRLRMGVSEDEDGMCRVSMTQASRQADGRITLESVGLETLDEMAGVPVRKVLMSLGATEVGTRRELFGKKTHGPERINVRFPEEAEIVPAVAYLLARVIPLTKA